MLRTLLVRTVLVGITVGLVANSSDAATRTWSGGGVDNNWATPLNWVGGVAPVANDSLVFDLFGRLTNTNNLAADTNITGITFAPTAGAFNLGGNRITLGGNIADNTTLLTQTIALPLLVNAQRSVDVTGQGVLVLSGIISETGGAQGLNKTGAGILTLSGANTFTGPINITGGTLAAGAANNLGGATATGAIAINGATFRSTGDYTIPATRGIILARAGGAGSGTIETLTGSDIIYNGVMANGAGGTGSLNKVRFGTLTLGGTNTYTGATNVRNGSVILNFADAAAPTTNIINSTSTLVLGGATAGIGQTNNATLSMTGKASTANVQTFNNTLIDIYGSVISATNGATGGTARLNLGALTHNLGGTVVIPTGGQITTTTNVTTTNGILGGWAIAGVGNSANRGITMGTDFATVGPDNGDGTRNIIAYTGYVTGPVYDGNATSHWAADAGIAGNADKNVRIIFPASNTEYRVDAENANTTTDINTLNFQTNSFNNSVLTIGTGNTLRFGKYGAIYKSTTGNAQIFIGGTGGGTFTPSPTANAGKITAGGAPNTAGELVVALNETANNSGGITIVSDIVDNGTGAVTLIKTSIASAKIDGHNSYSGGTYVNQGRLQLAGSEQLRDPVNNTLTIGNPDGLGTGPVFVAPGAYLFISGVNGTGQYTGPGAIAGADFSGGVTGAAASSAQNAPIYNNFTISGNGTSQEGIGAIRLGNRSLILGTTTLGGDARVGGGNGALYPRIELNAGSLHGATPYIDPGNEFVGQITGDFNFDLGGTTIPTNFMLSNTSNNWSGQTSIMSNGGNATRIRLGASEVIPHGTGKGNLVWSTGGATAPTILDMNGKNETINGLGHDAGAVLANDFIENNGFTATINDPTPGDLTNDDQTYVFTAGTSTLTVGGFDQSATFGGIIRNHDAAATISLPNPNWEGATDPEADPQFLTGLAPWVTAGSKIALTKIGTGNQTLSGINTYTGATTVNGGVLSVTGALNTASAVTVNNLGTIAGAGDGSTTGVVGGVTVNAGGRVAPGNTGPGTVGTLTASTLAVASGNVHIDFGGGTSDLVNVLGSASFTGANTITPFGAPTAGTYTVIQSTSAIAGANTLTLNPFPIIPNTRGASGTLNLTDPNAVKINVTGGAKTLTWVGNVNNEWDLIGDANWTDGSPQQFFNQDVVNFTDSSTNNNPVTLVGDLEPSTVTVNATRNYTFAGTGSITGNATLTKDGTGTLTITNSNSYAGATTINGGTLLLTNTSGSPLGTGSVQVNGGGTLQIGNAGTSGSLGTNPVTNDGVVIINRSDAHTVSNVIAGTGEVRHSGTGVATLSGASTHTGTVNINSGTVKATNSGSLGAPGSGTVNILAGATLDVGGSTATNNIDFGAKQFNVVGTGVGGLGAIINSNAANGQQNAFESILLGGATTFGAYGRFDVRGGIATLDLSGQTLTKKGPEHFGVVAGIITDGNVIVEEGNFALEGATTVQDFANGNKFTFQDGTRLQFFGTTGGTINRPMEFNGSVNVHNNAGAGSASAFDSPVLLKGAAEYTFQNTGQTTTQNGVISDVLGQPRGIEVETTATSSLVLTADNTFKGSVAVRGPGTLSLSPFSGIPYIADTANVSLDANSIINLGYTGTDTINALILGGVSLAAGVYDAVTHPTNFTGGGTLTVLNKILPGDFDNNMVVDARDYVKWRDNEGTFTILANDPLSGTEIDTDQYNIWRANFGNTIPGSGSILESNNGNVPEPGAVLLALMAIVAALFLRSRGA